MVTEFKGGKKKIVKKKLYPGYIVVHMIINDETWFLVRETTGIGDFTGAAGQPTPMLPSEVARIIPEEDDVETQEPKLQIGVGLGEVFDRDADPDLSLIWSPHILIPLFILGLLSLVPIFLNNKD